MFKPILAISLLIAPLSAIAQTAGDYFHHGAQSYINGDKKKAGAEIQTGLRLFPNDPELQQLATLLKKEEQEQKNQSGSGEQNQDQQKKDSEQDKKSEQQKAKPEEKSQADKDRQKADEEKQREEAEKQAAQQEQQDKANGSDQKQDADPRQASAEDKEKAAEDARREAAMMAAGQMTPNQAQQLLDSHKNDDKVFQLSPTNRPANRNRPYKNW